MVFRKYYHTLPQTCTLLIHILCATDPQQLVFSRANLIIQPAAVKDEDIVDVSFPPSEAHESPKAVENNRKTHTEIIIDTQKFKCNPNPNPRQHNIGICNTSNKSHITLHKTQFFHEKFKC